MVEDGPCPVFVGAVRTKGADSGAERDGKAVTEIGEAEGRDE